MKNNIKPIIAAITAALFFGGCGTSSESTVDTSTTDQEKEDSVVEVVENTPKSAEEVDDGLTPICIIPDLENYVRFHGVEGDGYITFREEVPEQYVVDDIYFNVEDFNTGYGHYLKNDAFDHAYHPSPVEGETLNVTYDVVYNNEIIGKVKYRLENNDIKDEKFALLVKDNEEIGMYAEFVPESGAKTDLARLGYKIDPTVTKIKVTPLGDYCSNVDQLNEEVLQEILEYTLKEEGEFQNFTNTEFTEVYALSVKPGKARILGTYGIILYGKHNDYYEVRGYQEEYVDCDEKIDYFDNIIFNSLGEFESAKKPLTIIGLNHNDILNNSVSDYDVVRIR